MLRGNWRAGAQRSQEGIRRLSEESEGYFYECNVGRGNLLRGLEELGDMRAVRRVSDELTQAAATARDRFTEVTARISVVLTYLAKDDLDAARADA